MKNLNEKIDFLEIPELGIKVAKQLSGKRSLPEAEKYCKKHGARMLNVLEAGYIFDNDLIEDFCKNREWLEPYSKKTRAIGFGCSALGRYWSFDGRLCVNGDDWDGDDHGHAFWVRLVFPIENKAREQKC